MKSKVIELQEKANQLLELAQAMDKRVEHAEESAKLAETMEFDELHYQLTRLKNTRKSASKRIWSAYLQVLTEIKLEL